MARNVFFSFHYTRDIFRVSRIRNCGTFTAEGQPFLDKAEWEKIKTSGDTKIKNWIDEQMERTSVLVACIGKEYFKRKWVRYEIKKAYREKRGIVGIYIHQMKNFESTGYPAFDSKGVNPLDTFYFMDEGKKIYLSTIFSTYDWVDDNGNENIETWIEEAANKVGR